MGEGGNTRVGKSDEVFATNYLGGLGQVDSVSQFPQLQNGSNHFGRWHQPSSPSALTNAAGLEKEKAERDGERSENEEDPSQRGQRVTDE